MLEIRITRETAEAEAKEFERIINGATPASIYDDVAELQTKVAALETELNTVTHDTGWYTLELLNDVQAYNEAQKPMYRRIGKTVFLAGVFKNVTADNLQIAILPVGFRPSKKVILPFASMGQRINRMEILTDGTIQYSRSTIEPTVATNWHSIAGCFSVN